MEINGKIYRNLEGQVGYLTEKWDDLQDQINDVRAHLTHYVIVDALPTEDIDTSAVYLVGPLGTAPDQYYEEWVYVETSESTWTWEKLGDTDSVDLSGYLEKQTGTTTYSQLYAKHADGGQVMFDVTASAVANAIVKRTAGAQVDVPYTPTATTNATSKDYVDSHFVAKDTSTTPYAKAYIKKADSTQDTVSISSTPNQGFIVQYNTGGTLRCKDPTGNGEEAVNLSYANDHYFAKDTTTSSYNKVYTKLADGSQAMVEMSDTARYNAVVRRTNQAQIVLPNQLDYTPSDDQAVSKRYVDAVVGQLIYHHDMVIQYTLTGDTDYVKIAAHSDNNTSTAFTGIDWHNMPLIMPDYAMYHHGSNDYLASVTKLPRGLHQDEFSEPREGFLLTYWDGSALQNVRVNESLFNTPTVTDVVTTW